MLCLYLGDISHIISIHMMFIHWHIHKHSLRQLTPHTIQMVISVYAVHIENATNVGVKDLQSTNQSPNILPTKTPLKATAPCRLSHVKGQMWTRRSHKNPRVTKRELRRSFWDPDVAQKSLFLEGTDFEIFQPHRFGGLGIYKMICWITVGVLFFWLRKSSKGMIGGL